MRVVPHVEGDPLVQRRCVLVGRNFEVHGRSVPSDRLSGYSRVGVKLPNDTVLVMSCEEAIELAERLLWIRRQIHEYAAVEERAIENGES